MKVYFDNAATTAIAPEVLAEMLPYFNENYGNPSSIHALGRKSRAAIEKARKVVANYLGASTAEIFFTSGGTEANNMILKKAVEDLGVKRLITTAIEHHCVLHTAHSIAKQGVEVIYLEVNNFGEINYEQLENLLQNQEKKTLVSLMHSNNEIGILLDLHRVGQLTRANNALFHTDSVQTVGYFPINVLENNIDFLSGSAHKFHGPKGIGFAYINGNNSLKPFIDGGSQERNMRAGTENLYGIVGLGKALEICIQDMEQTKQKIASLKQAMISQLKNEIADVEFNGLLDEQLSHFKVLNVSLPKTIKTDLIVFNLDIAGIAASGGSACSSGSEVGSHVLAGIQANPDRNSVRFSFSKYNTIEEVQHVVAELKKLVN